MVLSQSAERHDSGAKINCQSSATDKPSAGVKSQTHNTTAVSSLNLPVYKIAECLGRSSRALRYTSSLFLLCQRTRPRVISKAWLVCGSARSTHSETN